MDAESKSEWVRGALREHQGALVRYAAQITGDLDRARDVVQDTFLRLCAEDAARLDGHLTEWLFTVCRHRALDVVRKEKRMQPLDEKELRGNPGVEPSPAAQAAQNEDTRLVQEFVSALPANQQEVVRLKFQNGLSYKEISHITNLSVSNVGFLIHTAMKLLRQKMSEHEGPAQSESEAV
jgi:RNA polymerase sigma-70 factor (ECF subfamily)